VRHAHAVVVYAKAESSAGAWRLDLIIGEFKAQTTQRLRALSGVVPTRFIRHGKCATVAFHLGIDVMLNAAKRGWISQGLINDIGC